MEFSGGAVVAQRVGMLEDGYLKAKNIFCSSIIDQLIQNNCCFSDLRGNKLLKDFVLRPW